MTNKIAWEKWDETALIPEDIPEEDKPVFGSSDVDELDGDEGFGLIGFGLPMPIKVRTPLGFFHIDDPMAPSNMFDCWIGHTNFDITHEIADMIESVPGIESFRVMSRYRFFIGIAKLFNFREVRQEIQDIIGGESSSITKMADFEVVEVLRSQLSDFKRWAVFCSSDGFIDYIATNEDEDQEYDIKLRDFKQDKKYTVITSEDLE
jgi:hypothetical protein